MNRTRFLMLSGIAMLLGGLSIFFSQSIGVEISKIAIPILFVISGIFAIQFGNANKEHAVAKNFHLLQGLGMIAFGGTIIFLPRSLETFLMVVTFFTMLYGVLELIFAFSVLNLNYKLKMKMLIIRVVSGVLNLVGGFVLFMTLLSDAETGLAVAGVLVFFGGFSFIIFSLKVKE